MTCCCCSLSLSSLLSSRVPQQQPSRSMPIENRLILPVRQAPRRSYPVRNSFPLAFRSRGYTRKLSNMLFYSSMNPAAAAVCKASIGTGSSSADSHYDLRDAFMTTYASRTSLALAAASSLPLSSGIAVGGVAGQFFHPPSHEISPNSPKSSLFTANTTDSNIHIVQPEPEAMRPTNPRVDIEDAAQAVLSLRRSEEEEDWSPSDIDSCPTMDEDDYMYADDNEDDDDDDEEGSNLDEDNDVASRLKRIAVCCRKYNIRPNNFVKVVQDGGDNKILPLSDEQDKSFVDQARRALKKRSGPETVSTISAKATDADLNTDTDTASEKETHTSRRASRAAKRAKMSKDASDEVTASKRRAVKRAKTSKDASNAEGGKKSSRAPNEVYSHSAAAEFGKGWIVKGYQRKSGAYQGHIDKYWFSPIMRKRMRSKKEVLRFLAALEKCNGDENKAYDMK